MGFRFRKSVNIGPLRLNFSKSGVGYSFGVRGLRYTKKTNGGTRLTSSVPGTGLSYVAETGAKKAAASSDEGSSLFKPLLGSVAAVLVLVFAIVGCTQKNDTPNPDPTPAAPAVVEQQEETEPEQNEEVEQIEEIEPVTEPEKTPEPEPQPQPEPESKPQAEERKVYRTKSGKRYHYSENCNGGTYYETTLSEALARGLTPCEKCVG